MELDFYSKADIIFHNFAYFVILFFYLAIPFCNDELVSICFVLSSTIFYCFC